MMPPPAELPVVERVAPVPDIASLMASWRHKPHVLWLDSAQRHSERGRYSFLTADPFMRYSTPWNETACLEDLAQLLTRFESATAPGLPPFQGGVAGLFSYDLCRSLECVPPPHEDEFQVPVLALGFYDTVLAIDHHQDQAWIIAQGFPETDFADRRERAGARIAEFREWISQTDIASSCQFPELPSPELSLHAARLAPQYAIPELDQLTSNFTRVQYEQMIQRAIDYIYAGDVFQVNLSQRLLFPARDSSLALYLRLRERNPAPFAGYFDLGTFQVCSASPERFVRLSEGIVEARPIKGTRQRSSRPEADLFAADELRQSEKDRAENVMIVDLLRNDLSKVCRPDSVSVGQLCGLEVYEFVQHLVSVVCGELDSDRTAMDLIRAAFPGGSITGAPKVRALEIISELEPTARGPYCGSLGYIGFDGALDLSILIRTITAGRGWWQMPVGGGIVSQSTPAAEYEETWHKARGMLRALLP